MAGFESDQLAKNSKLYARETRTEEVGDSPLAPEKAAICYCTWVRLLGSTTVCLVTMCNAPISNCPNLAMIWSLTVLSEAADQCLLQWSPA